MASKDNRETGVRIRSFVRGLGRIEWTVKGMMVITGAVFPVLEGVIIGYYTALPDTDVHRADWARFLLAIGIVHIVLLLGTLIGPSTPAAAIVALDDVEVELAACQAEVEALQGKSDLYLSAQNCMANSLTVLQNILKSTEGPLNRGQRWKDFKEILQPFAENRDQVLNFVDGKSLFNLAVYLFNPGTTMLEPAYRRHDDRLKHTGDAGRSWPVGHGHVGICFAQEKVIITPNLQANDELYTFQNEQDRRQYAASASVPIYDSGTIRGVFIVTSSTPNQFNAESHDVIFESIGHVLSVYLTYTDDMEEVNHG